MLATEALHDAAAAWLRSGKLSDSKQSNNRQKYQQMRVV
jgi:hypothetical protein